MKIALVLATIVLLEITASAQPNAEDLYAQGQAAYERADYTIAIAKWQASYDLSKEAGLLFNLAQAKRLAGDCVGARATYRRFDEADPDVTSDQHKLAEDLARELDVTCDEPPAVVPRVGSTAVTPKLNVGVPRDDRTHRPGSTLRVAGLATGGTGIALLVTGLLVGRHARTLGDEVTSACTSVCAWSAQKGKDSAGRRAATIGYALDAVGAAAIACGTVMYYLGSRAASVRVVPAERRDGAVVSWSGSW